MPSTPFIAPFIDSSPSPDSSIPVINSQNPSTTTTTTIPPPPPHVASKLTPADLKDRTLIAIYNALSIVNNQALSAKELADICRERGLHAMGGATPSGTVNTAIRMHGKRARDSGSPCLFSWIHLAGDETDLRLAKSIGADAHRVGPEPERAYHCKKGGITRRGVRLFFLSDWTGHQNPFEREGLFDVPIVHGATATELSPDDAAAEHSHALETGATKFSEDGDVQIDDNVAVVSNTPFPALSPNEDMPPRPPYATHKFRSSAELIPANPSLRRRSLTPEDSDSEPGSDLGAFAFDRLNLTNFTWAGEPEDEDEDDLETVLSTPRSTSIESDVFSADDRMLRAGPASPAKEAASSDPATLIAYSPQSGLIVGKEDRDFDYDHAEPSATSDILNYAIHRINEIRIRPSPSQSGDDSSAGGNAGSVSGVLVPAPIDASLANSLEEHFHLDVLTATASYTPTGSPFTSTASTFSTDRASPFTPSTVSGDWPTLASSTPGNADSPIDLEAQNGGQRRKQDDDVQELLVGPEGVKLHELEEAWGSDGSLIAVPSLAHQVRHSSGMCVPMHTPGPVGRACGYGVERPVRGIKRSAFASGLDDDKEDACPALVPKGSVPSVTSLESYLVADSFSPSLATLPLKEDNGFVLLSPRLEAPILIHTVEPVYPAIYATQIESLPVFATAFGNSPRLLRRVDNDYVNLTTLATLSHPPISPETLQALIASCHNSHTIPFPSSSCSSTGGLSGAWISLADVQRLCANGDLNIPACVGEQFLSDTLPDLFPEEIAQASKAYKRAGVGMAGFGLHACPIPRLVSQSQSTLKGDAGFAPAQPPAKKKPGRPRRVPPEGDSIPSRSKKAAPVSSSTRRSSIAASSAQNVTRASLRSSARAALNSSTA